MLKSLVLFVLPFVYAQNQALKCGTAETDYAPCVTTEKANSLYQHCCRQYAPPECIDLCNYETDEYKARKLILDATTSGKCQLKYLSSILYCASQNQDNRLCCQSLGLADKALGVGDRCLRFCDPGGESGIKSIQKEDASCVYNWNVIMYCHHAGIKSDQF